MRTRGERGFTLVELLMVATLIIIIAAIAVPGMMRAKLSGDEASALGSLRSIVGGQSVFAASCGGGSFAPTLALLATPATVGSDGFIGPDLGADPIVKSGYTITLTGGAIVVSSPASCNGGAAGALVQTFFISANALSSGARYFGANQGSTIYQAGAAVAVTQYGAPAGATPIQ